MEFKGEKNGKRYTITVQSGKVRSVLVETVNSYDRRYYQRGPAKAGLSMNEAIFEEATLAFCRNKIISWMDLFDAIHDDKIYGQELIQKIFEKHFK